MTMASMTQVNQIPRHFPMPRKRDLFGVRVSPTTYDQVVRTVIRAARARHPAIVDLMPVHGLVTAALDPAYRTKIDTFDIVAPDGQPVRWALNNFHNTNLADRVYGPKLMWMLCEAAAKAGVSVYLLGSTPYVLNKLARRLVSHIPGLQIAGQTSPPFRALTAEEDAELVRKINDSGAGIVFLGLGCPLQETFAYEHRTSIRAVQLCVGAAFDFHAGTKRMAPAWMQRRGLEWLYRLTHEPRRLWKRYFVTNSVFIVLFAREIFRRRPPARYAGVIPDEVEPLADV